GCQQQLRDVPRGRGVAVRLQRPPFVRARGNAVKQVTLCSEEGFMVSPASRLVRLVALVAVLVGAPGMALAQNGRIRGTVRDGSGDALAGVAVRSTNQRTGLSGRATTGADGSYTNSGHAAGTEAGS